MCVDGHAIESSYARNLCGGVIQVPRAGALGLSQSGRIVDSEPGPRACKLPSPAH